MCRILNESFWWEILNAIHDHIDDYPDVNHSYSIAAVNPFKISPVFAITGLYIISSSMHPVYGYELHAKMETFLQEKCTNTSFLDTYHLSVVYGDAENTNLTMVHNRVYLYPGIMRN